MNAADTYAVVVNEEEQYSIWTACAEPPSGWRAVGFTGAKDDCLRHIAGIWTDMRPKSLRVTAGTEGTGQ